MALGTAVRPGAAQGPHGEGCGGAATGRREMERQPGGQEGPEASDWLSVCLFWRFGGRE